MEWRNQNSQRAYPLYENNQIDNGVIVDACFSFNGPLYLTKTEVTRDGNTIFWINDSMQVTHKPGWPYAFNDFAKIVFQQPPKNKTYTDLKFLETVVHPYKNLTMPYTTISNGLTIALPYLTEASFNCIQKINGEFYKHFYISRDNCTDVRTYDKRIYVSDICKPPCYDCDTRLTSGDVFQYMTTLEARIDALGTPRVLKSRSYEVLPATTSFQIADFSWMHSIIVEIETPFNGTKEFTIPGYITSSDINWKSSGGSFYFYVTCGVLNIVAAGSATVGKATIRILGT